MRTSLNDALAMLDRRVAFLCAQAPEAFLVRLGEFLDLLDNDARLSLYAADIERDATTLYSSFDAYDREECERLRAIRDKLTSEAFTKGSPDSSAGFTLEAFDRRMANPVAPPRVVAADHTEDDTNASKLHEILKGQFAAKPPKAEDGELDLERIRLDRAHRVRFRDFNLRQRRSPGLALRRLRFVTRQINPHGLEGVGFEDVDDDKCDELWRTLYRVKPDHVRQVVWNGLESGMEFGLVKSFVERARRDVLVVHEDLRMRIGSSLSRLGLLDRFKQRCEWYDAERMRDLADQVAQEKQKERRLTDELARFMFDEGVDALTEATVAGLRPDILGASGGLYVECKQYGVNDATPSNVRKWAHQVWSTLGRLRGTRFDVHEVFLVVFRRAGRRVALPDSVRFEGVTLYPRLVDVAPEAGSSEKAAAVVITEADLGPQTTS